MSVLIEAGKFYRTRDGRKVGPMEKRGSFGNFDYGISFPDERRWNSLGRRYPDAHEPDSDLISEWSEGPVVTETVKRIVPGVYGRVSVGTDSIGYVSICLTAPLGGEHREDHARSFDAPELRAAAAVLTQLADALEGK